MPGLFWVLSKCWFSSLPSSSLLSLLSKQGHVTALGASLATRGQWYLLCQLCCGHLITGNSERPSQPVWCSADVGPGDNDLPDAWARPSGAQMPGVNSWRPGLPSSQSLPPFFLLLSFFPLKVPSPTQRRLASSRVGARITFLCSLPKVEIPSLCNFHHVRVALKVH